MDAIGLSGSEVDLCDRLVWDANSYWLAKEAVLANRGKQRAVDAACFRLREGLVSVGDSGNFHLLVAAERILCLADLEHFQHTQQNASYASRQSILMETLLAGVAQMEEISDKLKLRDKNVQTFHRYSSDTITIRNDHDREGLPKDGIRKLLSSHKTRLQNRNRGMDGVGDAERDLMWHRRSNMRRAELAYKAMQRDALGGCNSRG